MSRATNRHFLISSHSKALFLILLRLEKSVFRSKQRFRFIECKHLNCRTMFVFAGNGWLVSRNILQHFGRSRSEDCAQRLGGSLLWGLLVHLFLTAFLNWGSYRNRAFGWHANTSQSFSSVFMPILSKTPFQSLVATLGATSNAVPNWLAFSMPRFSARSRTVTISAIKSPLLLHFTKACLLIQSDKNRDTVSLTCIYTIR